MAIFTKSFVLTGGESPSGTSITTTSQQIAASQTTGAASASGPWDVWALTAGEQISRNGTVDPNSALVTKLYYANHTLYQFNGTDWWYYNTARSTSTTFSWTSVNDPTVVATGNVWNAAQKSGGIVLSSDGLTATLAVTTPTSEVVMATETTDSGGQFASLIYWEVVLNADNTNAEVGIALTTTSVGDGEYLAADATSLGWRGDQGIISINNVQGLATWATFATGARLCFALDLVNGKLWGRVGGGAWNNDVVANQNPATNTGGFVLPATIYDPTIFIVAAASLLNNNETAVASFAPASWLFAAPVGFMPWSAVPIFATATIQSIVLSGSKSFTTGTSNAVVGTIAVNMSSGLFTGTLGLAGTDATSFQIVNVSGTNTLETRGALSVAKTYSVNIVATQTGITNSPFTGPTESIVGSVAGTLSAPAQAANAGFHTLAFNSDFTSTTDVTGDTTAASGFKWYPGLNFDTTYTVDRTTTAANINNGNVGGGSNASPAGGILTLLSQNSGWSGMFTTLPFNPLNFNGAVLPAVGQGHWGHAYFEAYMQFVSNGNTGLAVPDGPATGGPAFWSWAAQDLKGYGAGSSSLVTNENAEVDFMEHFGTMFGGSNLWESSLVHWQGDIKLSGNTYASGPTDSNWHTFGVLWQSTGNGTGSLTCYFDNAQQGQPFGTFSVMEGETLFMVLGTGNGNWHTNIDWVRVWTA